MNINDYKNSKISLDHEFVKPNYNKVMFNQYENCSCFSLDPMKPD